MDTKWRKSRIIISFTVFLLGMSLLISNFMLMLGLLAASEAGTLKERIGTDYQQTEEFRWFISGRLEELLGAATGGEGWNGYGVSYEYGYYNGYDPTAFWSWITSEEATDTIVMEDLGTAEYAGEYENGAYEEDWGNSGRTLSKEEALKSYMAELARDKNLRYAVCSEGKLLYTNLEELEGRIGEDIGKEDPSGYLSQKEYNFLLWFNQEGDGKVRISKDGKDMDIYGDGVYTEDSSWFVPGYTNFNTDESTEKVTVFLAAAREPKLYVNGNYSEYGSIQQSGRLYYLALSQEAQHERYQRGLMSTGAAFLLLILAFVLRKDRRSAREWLAKKLAKVWLEVKLLFLLILPIPVLWIYTMVALSSVMWMGEGVEYLMEVGYFYESLFPYELIPVLCFWLLYLAVLDLRANKGRQKKLLSPLIRALRTRDLHLSVQKRIVRRQFLLLLPAAFLLLTSGWSILYLWDIIYWEQAGFYLVLWLAGAVLTVFCVTAYLIKNRRLADDVGALADKIEAVRGGSLSEELKLPSDTDLKSAAENLNEIREGMEHALAERTRSERMKVELVTNVSHDIKTPLTSIVSYVELLKQEEELPEHVKDYIRILGEKSERLKTMVQDVFEVSKAASGQLPVNLEELDLAKLLRQTLADMSAQIEESSLTLKTSIPEEEVLIRADGQRLYRVFQNLIQNALQYSLKGSRIFLTLTDDGKMAVASIKNTSGTELNGDLDFTERFVRGDESRTDGGSGLGLSIARSFTEACGGTFQVETNADLFTVTVRFSR